MAWSEAKGVQTQTAPYPPILAPFSTGLDPSKAVAMNVAVAKHFRRRQGRWGARRATSSLSLFWMCRNDRLRRKRKSFYNVVTNPDVESRNQIFGLESMGETRQNLSFCAGSEGSK